MAGFAACARSRVPPAQLVHQGPSAEHDTERFMQWWRGAGTGVVIGRLQCQRIAEFSREFETPSGWDLLSDVG